MANNVVVGYENNVIDVYVVNYGEAKPEKEEFLVQFKGTTSKYDGKILKHKKVWTNQNLGYYKLVVTENIDELENWGSLQFENGSWTGLVLKAFVPGIDSAQELRSMKKEKAQKVNAQEMIATYEKEHKK